MNIKTLLSIAGVSAIGSALLCLPLLSRGADIPVKKFRLAGPFTVATPLMLDSLDNNGKSYDLSSLILSTPPTAGVSASTTLFTDSILPSDKNAQAINILTFDIDNPSFAKGKLKVTGVKDHALFLDGKKLESEELELTPGVRTFVLKTITAAGSSDTLRVTLSTDGEAALAAGVRESSAKRRYTPADIFTGRFMTSPSVSPSGRYMLSGSSFRNADGNTADTRYTVTDLRIGKSVMSTSESLHWMPSTDRLYRTRVRNGQRELVVLDPLAGSEAVLASGLPDDPFTISPTEDYLIYTATVDGPKEKSKTLYQIINPEDRQPGWRNRSRLMRLDFATGIISPLTFGSHSSWLCGISADGRKVLVMTGNDLRMTERPSSRMSLMLLDLPTMKGDTLVNADGFMAGASLSPDGQKVLLTGSPEAFDGIGNVLPEGVTPNAYDYQLYVMDVDSKAITPLTRDFDPSVQTADWGCDGYIYFTAQDRDREPLYRVNPADGKVSELPAGEDYIFGFSLASRAPMMAYYGESADNSFRLYTLDVKGEPRKMHPVMREDLHPERYGNIDLGKTTRWEYTNAEGDTIYASFNLPPDFDPAKKYPMIVYYYGGCSPTPRLLDTTYNPHLYAAQGYVALVINPRGATGFGQEYSSHHVATAGEGVAEDIITGVKKFCEEHPYVDVSKIGCLGASYGGFMTEYLQTVTDIFAAAISHAGISDHTSYWGNGYWGYSYSEVSMGDKYPWSDRELYVDHSPLYNADKINTPLLLLHGDVDTNVPFAESVQLFTALKRLGKETALVAVSGENHHVLPIDKRIEWINTQMAWFAKYLKNDPSWWNALYPEKNL